MDLQEAGGSRESLGPPCMGILSLLPEVGLPLGSPPWLTEFCMLALWESQGGQLGLAAASCVARCEQLPGYTAPGN